MSYIGVSFINHHFDAMEELITEIVSGTESSLFNRFVVDPIIVVVQSFNRV